MKSGIYGFISSLVAVGVLATTLYGENFDAMTASQLQVYITAKTDSAELAKAVLNKKLNEAGATRAASVVSDSITNIAPTAKTAMGLTASVYAVDSMYVQINTGTVALAKIALKTTDIQALILKAVNDTAVVARKDRALGVLRKLEEYSR